MVGARAPGTEQISQRVSYFCRYKKEEKWLFLKDALWGGGGTHRSWPGGRGGRPRALIPGEGVREGLAWRGKAGSHQSWLGGRGVQGGGARARGGCKGFGSGGVGGRDTGLRDGANFATCVVFLSFLTRTKRRKMAFFEGCPVGWRGVPTGAGLVDGGVDQGPWLQEIFLSFLTRTKEEKWLFLKDALWGGDGGVGRVGLGKAGWVCTGAGLVDARSGRRGKGLGEGGARASVRDGANFATGVVFLSFLTRTKRRKMAFFEGCPVGWAGVPTGAGLVDGGIEGLDSREGVRWVHRSWLGGRGVREAGQGLGGGVQGLRFF